MESKTKSETLKMKIVILIYSIIFTAFITMLFFLDKSLEWNTLKITSCIIVDIWCFCIIPSFRYEKLKLDEISFEEAFKQGMSIGASGIFLPLLIAPYYTFLYYSLKTNKLDKSLK